MGRADRLTTVSVRRSRPAAVVIEPLLVTMAPGEESGTGVVPRTKNGQPAPVVQQHLDSDLADDLDDASHQTVAGDRGAPRCQHAVQSLAAARGLMHLVGDERDGFGSA